MEKHWETYELYFHHEFINGENFPEEKKDILQKNLSFWYIKQDFTIYQEKDNQNEEVTVTDFHNNLFTFTWMLRNLPIPKVNNLMEFHYQKYSGIKEDFLKFVYHELKAIKHHQGNVEIDPPQQKIIAIEWCQYKLQEFESIPNRVESKSIQMHNSLPKLIALKERVQSAQNIHNSVPSEIFNSMKNQFFKEVELLKNEYDGVADFIPSNYDQFKTAYDSYFSWASKALIGDIKYFIDFLDNIKGVRFEIADIELSDKGIYFSGQHFDALLKISKIIANAKREIILVDNYLNENILEMLAGKNFEVKCRVLTLERSLSPILRNFIDTYNKQYKNLEVKSSAAFHDRFLVLDKTDFYHFGASLKDAGNKGFMFSKIEEGFIKKSLLDEIEIEWNK